MSQITVLGTGAMGSRMAANLIKAGHAVTVWNRTESKTLSLIEQGASVAKTPRAAVQNAEVVISMVRDDEASREVWLNESTGALEGMSTGVIALESSTLTVAWTKTLAKHFQNADTTFLDAPVAGSLPQAEAAQLIYLVGGEANALEQVKPILKTLGSAIHHAGAVGNGMAIKLAVNTLFGVQAAAIAELIGFVQSCGLEPAAALEILTATPVCSPAARALAGAMVAQKFAPLFPIDLVAKDLSYLTATAQANQVEVPLGSSTLQVFNQAIREGHGADNITGVAQLYS